MSKRPKIPESTQRELWARAAGRCQFFGCNILLYKDTLTHQRSNLATISHIVAFSPDGPRGDPIRSKLLETDINNLLLTCKKHGKLIDDKNLEEEYPEALLVSSKQNHETRVRRATEITEDPQTHVLIFQAPINGRDVHIDHAEVHRAIRPKYPAEDHPFVIDLSGTRLPAEGEDFFRLMAHSISNQLEPILNRRGGAARITSLSIFALAPIPLLIHLGHCLGTIQNIDLYQKQYRSQDWGWMDGEDDHGLYTTVLPKADEQGNCPQALAFSISGWMRSDLIKEVLGNDTRIYELQAHTPSRDFLRSRKQLDAFGVELRTVLGVLCNDRYQQEPIHVFLALPAPLAIEFGRHIRTLDIPFIIYEYEDSHHAYRRVMAFNVNSS